MVQKGYVKTWRSGPPSQSPGEETLRRLYVEEALSYAEIARRHGVTAQTVMRWLRAAGIPARSQSEATTLGRAKWEPTDEHREKLSDSLIRARAAYTQESREKWRAKMLGRPSWNKDKRCPQLAKYGEKNPMWKGGPLPDDNTLRTTAEWKAARLACYQRDSWKCRDCGVKCTDKGKTKIQAHHLVSRRDGGSHEIDNLVTLCVSCHLKREVVLRR